MKMFWMKPPYPASELKDKTIQFKIWVKWLDEPKPVLITGSGAISVCEAKDGTASLKISTHCKKDKSGREISLPQSLAKQITRQEKGARHDYSLIVERSRSYGRVTNG
jgi:hypothetical protein